jgi:hypothetical protein
MRADFGLGRETLGELVQRREVLLDRLLELDVERYAELARWARGDRTALTASGPLATPALRARHLAWLAFGEARRAGDTLTQSLLRPWATLEVPKGDRRRVAWVAGHITVETGWACTWREAPGDFAIEFTAHDGHNAALAAWFHDYPWDPRSRPDLAVVHLVDLLHQHMRVPELRAAQRERLRLQAKLSPQLTIRLGMPVEVARGQTGDRTVIGVTTPQRWRSFEILDTTFTRWASLGETAGQERLVQHLREQLAA